MKISLNQDPRLEEIEVIIKCPRLDYRVSHLIATANMLDLKLTGFVDEVFYVVGLDEVLYVESVEGKAFIYLSDKVLESRLKLAEIEELCEDTELLRISRSMLVNMVHVSGLRPYLNARLELVMDNGERVIASRFFSQNIKRFIGLGK